MADCKISPRKKPIGGTKKMLKGPKPPTKVQ